MHPPARRPWVRLVSNKVRHAALGAVVGGITGAAVMFLANAQVGVDQAAKLAASLGSGNGPILAALLGVAIGGALATGGREAIARSYGIAAGIAAACALYALGHPHAWILTSIVTGAFGPDAAPYASLLAFLLLAAAFRLAAPLGRLAAEALLRSRTSRGVR